ncbi:MAG: ABC transporter ATP-binding protein [Coriobacteriaceae bacterium]|jgi:iron complex transport system ATP-binding protein|nr:ABC transporter ATP-binding protein [Atopobiaceae bacterium]MCI1539711.1 ABC transporter ATP-binding protein [Atopobiaceae bacterium]RRF90592.1 MAG: ABC transporter ATP-binding protein [Coriobacteriaceae bacterium]
MSDVLTFQDISFGYGERKLFEGFSLAIPEGGITAVLGPNGCGKSTLLALAEGMLKPACGAVLLSGTDTLSLSAKERAGLLAMLPQVHRTPSMKVRDLVACGRYTHMGPFGQLEKADWDKVDEAISLMGLEGLRDRNARKLSGGERQRAFLAMTVAQGARTLLLDEPTTYLDVRAALDLMQLVRRLADEQGATIVCVTHDVDLALRFSDGICVLGSARPTQLLAEGTPEEIAGSSVLAASLGISAVRFAHAGEQAYGIFPADAV